jgi:hypothetical protein
MTPEAINQITQGDVHLAGALLGCTAEQEHQARLYVAGSAKDVEDARTLLKMLGLIEQDAA